MTEDGTDPHTIADAFLTAVYESDPGTLWRSFSDDARQFIVARGVRRGLPADLGKSILEGSAEVLDHVEFLADLLGGIEKDLENIDLDRLVIDPETEVIDDGKVRIRFAEKFNVEVGPELEPLPVGSLVLTRHFDEWRVDRLIPRPG